MLNKLFLLLLCSFMWVAPASANNIILTSVPQATVVGRGVLSYAFWDIYEATLYAPKGRFDINQPFALSIKYYHAIDGQKIANKSIEEMRKQGFKDEVKLAAWHTQMRYIFPNVKKGTVLSAIYKPKQQTTFYHDNKLAGTIKGDDFSKLFFGIWLSQHNSKPELRQSLLGLS